MRRRLLDSLVVAMAFACFANAGCSKHAPMEADASATTESQGLSILILGGTGFIGPHMVREAESRGHTVTLFNRGQTNNDLFSHLETLIGDRDGQLQALEGRTWDAVIDNSGYVPRHCRDSAELLAPDVGRYLFISTISVYDNFENAGINEDYTLGTMADETVEDVTGETYGPMKVLCEKAVQAAYADRATIVRPGYIVGPGDRTDRWTYWPVRVSNGGQVAVPGSPVDAVQYIDARDLAKFVVHLLEQNTSGIFNAVGPGEPMTMAAMLDIIKAESGSDASFAYLDPASLDEKQVSFPIWASSSEGAYRGVLQVDNARAVAAGLTHRSTADTVRDTLAWWNDLDEERRDAMRSGLRIGGGPPGPQSMEQQMAAETALLNDLSVAE